MNQAMRLGPAAAVKAGTGQRVDVNGTEVAVFNLDGQYFAVSGTCPHHGGPIGDGRVSGTTVECPWHRWEYDIMTGRRVDKVGSPLETFEIVCVEGSLICVDPPQ